jgi:hypothetical protein
MCNLFYNYWHILVGDRTKNYHPEMPGWRVLGCTCRGGHFRQGSQINEHTCSLFWYRLHYFCILSKWLKIHLKLGGYFHHVLQTVL